MSRVRVRFAPSPTGMLHVGGARTALFNWLYARHTGGQFVLRIEDTDRQRSQQRFVDEITDSLRWLGLQWDEGPHFQSQRMAIYREQIERLLAGGKARKEGEAVLFTVDAQQVVFDDLLHGTIRIDGGLFSELVLMKSDGTPTYNFACVVDDALMGITHIIRGDDHISNTPKQVVLYQALGFAPPTFAHIPLIVDDERARLSKRTGATAVTEFRTMGYLPEGMVNYLALLGWAPKANKEVVEIAELPQLFELERVKKTAAAFNVDKLEWINGQHMKRAAPERLWELIEPRVRQAGVAVDAHPRDWWLSLVALLRERMKTLTDFETLGDFFWREQPEYREEAVAEHLRKDGVAEHLLQLRDRLAALAAFTGAVAEEATRGLIAELGTPSGAVMHPARVALTGRTVSPPLFAVMEQLGQARVVERLAYAATLCSAPSKG